MTVHPPNKNARGEEDRDSILTSHRRTLTLSPCRVPGAPGGTSLGREEGPGPIRPSLSGQGVGKSSGLLGACGARGLPRLHAPSLFQTLETAGYVKSMLVSTTQRPLLHLVPLPGAFVPRALLCQWLRPTQIGASTPSLGGFHDHSAACPEALPWD